MNLTNAKPLFGFARSNHYEVVVHGIAAFSDSDGHLKGTDGNPTVVMRSLLKPWQFLSTGMEVADANWTLAIGSHDGDREHLEALAAMSQGHGLSIEDLHCPASYPMLAERAWELRLSQQREMRIYHPCSGKHLAMAVACKHRGWDEDYTSFDHPIKKRLDEIIQKQNLQDTEWLVDSCGLPTLAAPLDGVVSMWRHLAEDDTESVYQLKQAWVTNPVLVGGKARLDTRIVQWGKGYLIAKEGADGLLAVFSLPRDKDPVQGCFVKLTAGYNSAYLGLALWNLLSENQDSLNPTFKTLLDQLEQIRNEWVPKDQVLIANPV